ncbi:DMT family transporter [Desulfobotulus mexicanus]|uniref:Multidrug efflux SMR transporter n=1 Tax=Desulfobotulus mexicanus TaxID=2586642 RepID=A0A5S5MF37_9BACT|nr:multidrug efflux SMR transporter [Desulfobotulus mexicanus]TYT74343.1 multidrug efflux SMR transporter [Desulfobotulus mexicanus]
MPWVFLSVAIFAEVCGTLALKASDGFTNLYPSIVVLLSYTIAFYCLSLTLRSIPVGIAYAVWAGAGVALIAILAWIFMGQKLDWAAIFGLSLIVAGVVVLNVFSKTVSHV